MDFLSYPKIELRSDRYGGGAWIATEKVHGANFTVATDGAEVRFGKRKAWLEPEERFFGWQLLRAELSEAVMSGWRKLGSQGVLRLHGELFGGHYPHPSVSAIPGCEAVQTGIWYAPDVRFALFDAFVEPARVFLSFDELVRLAALIGLPMVPVLARGSRSELRRIPVRYPSRVATSLGLPAIDGNFAEGYVLKPVARLAPEVRSIIKCKLPEFDERRFDEARPWAERAQLSVDELLTVARRAITPRASRARARRSAMVHRSPRKLSTTCCSISTRPSRRRCVL